MHGDREWNVEGRESGCVGWERGRGEGTRQLVMDLLRF
jgi:hypothetical protein